MIKQERAALLESCVRKFDEIASTLSPLTEEPLLPCDSWALMRLLGAIQWAAENSCVMAKHAVGEKLDDDMGFYCPPGVGPNDRQLPEGTSVLEANTHAQSELP